MSARGPGASTGSANSSASGALLVPNTVKSITRTKNSALTKSTIPPTAERSVNPFHDWAVA